MADYAHAQTLDPDPAKIAHHRAQIQADTSLACTLRRIVIDDAFLLRSARLSSDPDQVVVADQNNRRQQADLQTDRSSSRAVGVFGARAEHGRHVSSAPARHWAYG
ncbi:MAG: hypothetical protein M3R24_30775 [Chloroflexota bacterium]|nr:hypothetical protein [Chloroflexota bacterium]